MYKEGFGDLSSEFFIGLDKLHAIVSNRAHELYVYLEDYDGQSRYARYDDFIISSANQGYQLQKLGTYSGDAGDALRWHEGNQFSTFDTDHSTQDCAVQRMGAYWYGTSDGCTESCPQWEGLYTIQVPGAKPFKALCDSTLAGDGWLIIARRFDGSVNFYRNWTMYKEGFGDLSSEFFIGLENLHAITASQAHELYVYLEDFDGNKRYASYDGFAISSENDFYKLQILGAYSGDAGDGLRFHVDGAKPFKALCDSTLAGDGWLIIARRFDGSVNFYRNWTMYKEGFGDLSSEFFIGLENLHAITASQAHELYVYLEDFDGNKRYANYDGFVISSEIDSYKLQILGAYSGDAGDGLRFHVDGKFATFDKFNSIDYAVDYRGGWWYNKGWKSNLFGAYMSGEFNSAHGYCGMAWSFWRGFYYSYKNIQMMVRPKCNRLQD
ncbi:maker440 [Drosophila busckii]|uniref:Maker440 n=1 Tax=Drosophila busckii TaxID=30019 RepID=A0A0M4EPJ9_DROBS|nr:maker440 [Drosophila busckii]